MADPTSGALNPYALAEIALGRKVDWANTPNAVQVMADALNTPANELFDPKYKSLTYVFRDYTPSTGIQTRTLDLAASTKQMTANDLATIIHQNPDQALTTLGVAHAANMPIEKQRLLGQFIGNIIIWPLPPILIPWTPPGGTWVREDESDFFENGTQFDDPVQGALGDCWLIATLSSIAWTRPTVISDVNRPTSRTDFVDQITLGGKTIEVSEKVPMGGTPGQYYYMFARGSDAEETWPAIYEKAFAKWKSGNLTDDPPYPTLNGNSPSYACQTIIPSLTGTWHSIYNQSDASVASLMSAQCQNQKSINPMMACTWGSADDAKKQANLTLQYDGTTMLVADHCYSILGFTMSGDTQYVVLRNPWGYHEGQLDALHNPQPPWTPGGTSNNPLQEAVSLNTNGVFAMKTSTFKLYFPWIVTF